MDDGRIVSPQDLVGNNCLAYTTFVFGQGISTFLTAQLVADIALINTIDLICPNWFGSWPLLSGPPDVQRSCAKEGIM